MRNPELPNDVISLNQQDLLKIEIKKDHLVSNCISLRDKDHLGGGSYGYSCYDSHVEKSEIKETIISLIKTWMSFLSIPRKMAVICFSCEALDDAEDVIGIFLDDVNYDIARHNHYVIVMKDFEKNKIKIKASLSAASTLYVAENSVSKVDGEIKFVSVNAISENKKNSFSSIPI